MPDFSGLKILCIGDVMLDRYVYGHVDRISPEAPVAVHVQEREELLLGGVGTVVRNIVDLGATAYCVSVIGDDSQGKAISDIMSKMPRTGMILRIDTGRVTTCKTRFITGNHQVSRADYETMTPVSEVIRDEIIDQVRMVIASCHAVTLSDYGKGIISRELVTEVVRLAKMAEVPVIVDPKSHDFTIYQGATVLTPNLSELFRAALYSPEVPEPMKDSKDVEMLAGRFLGCCDNMLVTRGKDGMMLLEGDGTVTHIPADTQKVYDVTGAGDTVVAVLALGMAAGMELIDAARLANKAAGIVVGKMGTATVSQNELFS